jgi:hypothetical protein
LSIAILWWWEPFYISLGLYRGLTLSIGTLPSGLGVFEVPVRVSSCLGMPTFLGCWVLPVPVWLALVFFFSASA